MDNHFVITIGRQFGSGGGELGRTLAQKLNIPFYDKELLYQAATQAGMNPDFFVNSDERVPKFINGAIPFSFGINPLPWHNATSAISDESLYRSQSDFIHNIASQGSCVIVGRTADFILRDFPNVVSIFVHATMEDRVRRLMQRAEGQSDVAKTQKLAERVNKLRANYYNFYTDKHWGDAASYDLTFNSSLLPIEDIADVVIEYINRRFGKN